MAPMLAWLLLLTTQAPPAASPRPAPRRPAAPAQTTLDAVLAGKHAAGRSVDFPAILLAPTASQTTSRGQVRYFVLAVKKDSAYFRGLAELATELREVGLVKAKALAGVTKDDARYRAQMKEVDDLVAKAIGDKTARLAMVPVEAAVVVEVAGMEALGSAYNWETVVDKNPLLVPKFSPPSLSPFVLPPSLQTSWNEIAMRRDLLNLSLGRPPDLSKKLPEFPANPQLASVRELESYNAAVELFNSELDRRRVFAVQRTEEDVRFFLERIERFLAMEEQTLGATVTAKVDLATETYTQIQGKAPVAFVKERVKGDAAFVKRSFQTASLFLTSYPSAASVSVDGQDHGMTPVVIKDLPVGSKAKIVLSRAGYVAKQAEETTMAQPSGMKRLDLSLDSETLGPVRLVTDAEAKTLFAADFKPQKRFSLAVFASSERLGWKGKKDKDGSKRADAIRKAAAAGGYFELSVSHDTAELMLEVAMPEGDEAKLKDQRLFKITYRGEAEEESFSESLSLYSEKANAERLLARMAEQLKQRRFKRALGIEG